MAVSFWNGPARTRRFDLDGAGTCSGWPTIYIIDHKGIIRFKGPRGEAMDKAVDQLLSEIGGTP